MQRIYKAIKVFVIAIVASSIITGAGMYVVVPKIMDDIRIAERRAIAQFTKVSSEYKAADAALETQVLNSIGSISNLSQSLSVLSTAVRTSNEEFLLALEGVTNKAEASVGGVLDKYNTINNFIIDLDERAIVLLDAIKEMNIELSDIRMRQDELTLIQAGVASVNKDVLHNAIESVGACPTNPINRGDHLPSLRRTVQNTSSELAGTHEFMVSFDVTEEGETIFNNIESGTANGTLTSAVQQYVDGLKFEGTDNSFENCEMIVKLNIN